MQATALKKFTASISGLEFDCEPGDALEADAKTIGQLESIGFVTTKEIKGASKPRKAGKDD